MALYSYFESTLPVLELDLNQNHYLMATSSESYEVSRIIKTSPFRSEGTRTRRPNKKKKGLVNAVERGLKRFNTLQRSFIFSRKLYIDPVLSQSDQRASPHPH